MCGELEVVELDHQVSHVVTRCLVTSQLGRIRNRNTRVLFVFRSRAAGVRW